MVATLPFPHPTRLRPKAIAVALGATYIIVYTLVVDSGATITGPHGLVLVGT